MPRAKPRTTGWGLSVALAAAALGEGCWSSATPHSLQNFALVRLGPPQAGQCRGKAVPQTSQNFAASELCQSQLGHCMSYIARCYCNSSQRFECRASMEKAMKIAAARRTPRRFRCLPGSHRLEWVSLDCTVMSPLLRQSCLCRTVSRKAQYPITMWQTYNMVSRGLLTCLLLALSGHPTCTDECPISGVKRT